MATLAETLRQLRESYGFSIAEVASLASLSSGRVVSIEGGEPPTVRELALLGGALAVDPAVLHAGRMTQPQRTVARFRAPMGIASLSGRDARLLAVGADCGRIGAALARMLGRPLSLVSARAICGVKPRTPAWKQGYSLGENARLRLAPQRGPVQSVQALLEHLGVHVASVNFQSEELEAASIFEPGALPVVLLNAGRTRVQNPLSRRAILAHEICHLLHDGGERDLTTVSRDHDESPFEQRANGFAPNFLAPGNWVTLSKAPPETIAVELARAWGLTYEGAVWHAKNLKYIDPTTAEELIHGRRHRVLLRDFEQPIARLSAVGCGIEDSAGAMAEGLLSDLAIQACIDGHISRGRLREVLSLR